SLDGGAPPRRDRPHPRDGALPRPRRARARAWPTMSGTTVERYLQHLRVERRVSAHTLAAYGEALARLAKLAAEAGLALERVQSTHVRRFAAQLHGGG